MNSRDHDEFLEMVAHELRTPLSAIVGFLDLLRRHHTRFDQAQTLEVLDRAGASARELDDLLGRMLIWSRLHAGRVTLLARPLRLYEEIAAQVVALAPVLEGREVQVDVDEALTVWADRAGLVQIVDNLLANAAAFSTPGTLISIRASSENRRDVRVEIEDRGPGFEPAEQAHLFDRVSQIPMSPRAQGAGLGLGIAARYIELHGGRIGVVNQPDAGSAFWFTLPNDVDR